MALSPTIVNALLIGGMGVGILLLIGVVSALTKSRSMHTMPASRIDPMEIDLENRLQNLGLGSMSNNRRATTPTAPVVLPPEPSVVVATVQAPVFGARQGTGDPVARKSMSALPPSSRLGLPDSGRLAQGAAAVPGSSVDPLAARFSASELPPPSGRLQEFAVLPPNASLKDMHGAPRQPAHTGPLAPHTAPTDRPAGAGSGRFTEVPARPALPPSETLSARGAAMPTERLERVQQAMQPFGAPAAVNVGSILRGEAVALASGTPARTGGPAAGFEGGSMTAPVDNGPLGSVIFVPSLVRLDDPLSFRKEIAPGSDPVAHAGDPFASDRQTLGGFVAAPAGGTDANGAMLDMDATRIIEDFDIPDAGFETHVFSTAELIDDDPFSTFLGLAPAGEAVDLLPNAAISAVQDGPSVGQPRTSWSNEEVAAQLADLAKLANVSLVQVLTDAGQVYGSTPTSAEIARVIAALVNTVRLEAQRLDLGDCSSLSVESPAAALLLSPLAGGAVLVLAIDAPAKLALVRRQLRKPLAALQSVLAVHGIS